MVGISISHRGRMAALVVVSARRSHKPLSADTSRSFLCTILGETKGFSSQCVTGVRNIICDLVSSMIKLLNNDPSGCLC